MPKVEDYYIISKLPVLDDFGQVTKYIVVADSHLSETAINGILPSSEAEWAYFESARAFQDSDIFKRRFLAMIDAHQRWCIQTARLSASPA